MTKKRVAYIIGGVLLLCICGFVGITLLPTPEEETAVNVEEPEVAEQEVAEEIAEEVAEAVEEEPEPTTPPESTEELDPLTAVSQAMTNSLGDKLLGVDEAGVFEKRIEVDFQIIDTGNDRETVAQANALAKDIVAAYQALGLEPDVYDKLVVVGIRDTKPDDQFTFDFKLVFEHEEIMAWDSSNSLGVVAVASTNASGGMFDEDYLFEDEIAATQTVEAIPTDTPEPTNTPEPVDTPEPTSTPVPVATLEPEAALEQALNDAIGASNRGIESRIMVSQVLDIVNIEWAIDDNLTENLIVDGVKLDLYKMLQTISETDHEYQLINFTGTFPLIDVAGNSQETEVVRASYTVETVNGANWPNVLFTNIYLLAESVNNHTLFAEETIWYIGGTLHQSTSTEWLAGTEEDRLATAADWTTAVTEWNSEEELRMLAEELTTCVTGSIVEDVEFQSSELAAICAVLMGWELGD